MQHRTVPERLGEAINLAVLILAALVMLFPFYYIVIVSFSSYQDYMESDLLLWPKHWVLDSYSFIFASKEFIRSIGVTVFITVVGALFSLIMTSSMGFALTRRAWGQSFFMFLVLFTFIFSAGLIPSYLIVKETGLIDTYWALIIPVAINPFNLIVMRQFFMGIPEELNESAVIDGANEMQIFLRIIIPLSKPALAAFGLFYAVVQWNTYFSAILYLNTPSKWTVQVILRQIVILNDATNTLASAARDAARSAHMPPPETIGMAAILLATVPILIVYPFLQKHFAKGVMLGSVKG